MIVVQVAQRALYGLLNPPEPEAEKPKRHISAFGPYILVIYLAFFKNF